MSQASVSPEDIKKAVDTVAELRKMLEEKLKVIDELSKKTKELEEAVNTLSKKVAVQRIIVKRLLRRSLEGVRPNLKPEVKPEKVFKSEEVKRKLEELKKKLMEKKASRVTTPRPETATAPEPAGGDEEFREFIKKVLSGKATSAEMPVKFRALPEVKVEGGEKK